MFNKKRALTAAVLLSCSFFMAPYYAHAEEEEPSCDHPSSYITVEAGKLTYNFDIYTASTHPGPHWRGEYTTDDDGQKIKEYAHYRDLFTREQQVFGESIAYMHNMINPSGTTNPTIKLELLPDQDANAAAQSETYIIRDANGKPSTQISDTELAAVLQGKYHPEDNDIVAEIEVDLAPPDVNWYIEKFPSLPSNGTDGDYYGTITHEMFHALGLGTYINKDYTTHDATFGTTANYKDEILMSKLVFNKYEMGIRDVFNRVVYYEAKSDGTNVYYDTHPINPNADNITITGELKSRKIVPISLQQFNHRFFIKKDDEFYVLKGENVGTNSGTYFTGKNVEAVLNGALIAWPDGSEVQPVPGLPLNGYEGDETTPELSHIELQNCLMSHQSYRNWCSFTEAELAILQDLGFNVYREAYYGKSIYNSGTVDDEGDITYFSYNNEQTFNSTQMHGIGLHVYGSYVDVEQSATLNADGAYGTGIRVDGVGNKVTIASDISAKNVGGNGLLVAYGKEHKITLNANKTIEATGADGVAARFDFGSNELGDQAGYRGSYINTSYTSQEEIDEREAEKPGSSTGMQVGWSEITEDDVPDAIQGALVENFNVAGNLIGSKAAIYISPNAYVKNINILEGADIQGDITSEWNPIEIIYQNEDGNTLAPALPDGEGLTNLNINTNLTFNHNIIGGNSLVLNLGENKIFTNESQVQVANVMLLNDEETGIGSGGEAPTATNQTIDVYAINVASNATFDTNSDLTVGNGVGTITLAENATFNNNGTLNTLLFGNKAGTQFAGSGTANISGTVNATLAPGYYGSDTVVNWLANGSNTEVNQNITSILLEQNDDSLNFEMFDEIRVDVDNGEIHIHATRVYNAYSQYADDPISAGIAKAFDLNASTVTGDAQDLVAAIDFSEDDEARTRNMKKLNPNVVGSSAQATLNTHNLLNTMNMLGGFSNNVPAARTGGGRGPAADVAPKYNSWRNIVMPFSAYTDQHNGNNGYTNHNSGVIGAMERTLENGLTHGYHAALNHQSTSDSGSQIKGEGLYLGAQASYAPADWNGWSLFSSARLGVEQMRSHRNVSIGGYTGKADADWTGYSGSLNVGTALTKEHGVLQSGPFAALDYSFAHRPSVHEDGGGIRTELASATYDSLRTQLGYRLSTKPKALDNYDSTKWQAHASVAWNHELLSNNGRTSYQLSDFPGSTIEDTIETYGRDSMSIAAGITFKTPKRLDVDLTLGSDIYRHGGSSVYGKVNFEWKF